MTRRYYICLLFVVLFLLFIGFNHKYTFNYVDSESMEPTIMKNTIVICKKISAFDEIKRGDVITFYNPLNNDEVYIKRVIGLPGECIEINEGKIMIDNKLLKRDYNTYKWTKQIGEYKFYVPNDSFVVLGDNRNISEDSRTWLNTKNEEERKLIDDESYAFVKRDSIISKWEK